MHRSGLVEMEAVLAVARRASFRAAAADLEMSTTAVSHAIAGLEARLGVRLFNRTTRSVALTAAGEQFVASIAPAVADIRGAMTAVTEHRDRPAGTLRINSSVTGAHHALAPFILPFLDRYRDMHVELVTERRHIDIVSEGYDAGIRLADAVPKDMIAVPLTAASRLVIVASPEYLAHRKRPRSPDDLKAHRCIRTRARQGRVDRWELSHRKKAIAFEAAGALTLDDQSLVIDAALAGAGLAHVWDWAAAPHLAEGRLVTVLEDWTPSFAGVSLYYPSRRHLSAGLRAFVELARSLRRRRPGYS